MPMALNQRGSTGTWAFRISFLFVVFSGACWYNSLLHQHLRQQIISSSQRKNSTRSSYFSTYKDDDRRFEIVATNFGWTTPQASQFSRRKVTGEFFNSIVTHHRYNSTAWEDLERHPDPSRRVVAFLDIDTCIEGNYPVYGTGNFSDNSDVTVPGEKFFEILDKSCKYIKRAVASPALTANEDSRLVILDCGDGPYYRLIDVCGQRDDAFKHNDRYWGRQVLESNQVIIAYYGTKKQEARPIDIGLPPPAVNPITLTAYERHRIKTCETRDYLFSFRGRGEFTREKLLPLDNGKDVYVRINSGLYASNTNKSGGGLDNPYEEIMRDSVFAGAPRGDCLWSYRFTEAFSAGSIPVVYSNDWLPPFSSSADPNRVVDWSKCAVFVGEGRKKYTLEYLHDIREDVRCEMQKCALAFWDEFASSRDGWLKGILSWVNNEHNRTNQLEP